ncbi:hypothetical protein GOBAR_DD24179 [Gossypium barbadense]|nr:hypothetical protein GOBAR_DD24179 [Gossypium barbadense]
MPPAMPPLKLPCLCSSSPSLAPLPPLFLLIRRPRVVASMRAMLTATPVSPLATSSPLALTAAPVPRDVQVDFDDKTSWEYLFKLYWVLLKEKLALSLHELTNATNPWKELREASANIEPKHQNDRFGVKQKEKIASFKTSVDVLTLSATPIPRTLYLALTGFRDASSRSTGAGIDLAHLLQIQDLGMSRFIYFDWSFRVLT